MKLTDAATIPPAYRGAFDAVDRRWFIPARMWVRELLSHGTDEDTDDDIAVDRDTEPELWERAVYADVPIVTQWDDGDTRWPDVGYLPTCSASAPSVVAAMLSTLDPQPGDTVLEIGTGTGYNAALLSDIVGENGRVVTVEVDPTVAGDAAARLARYPNVEVITGDGLEPIRGQWNRVIATASVYIGRIPYWWVAGTRPGGVLVAPMRSDMTTGPLVRFVVGDDDTAIGFATPQQVGFMSLRAQRPAGGGFSRIPWDDPTADTTGTA
ncbi:MAG: rRNA adenine N-6-methyltransferase family protein, partial [Stackebrandtia sp.]